MTIEAHIPGFDGDLYGRNITVCLKRRIRDEKKFGSVHELIQQINEDIATALL
jgi:FAD synthase